MYVVLVQESESTPFSDRIWDIEKINIFHSNNFCEIILSGLFILICTTKSNFNLDYPA